MPKRWCAPCRTFNRSFVKDYKYFKDRGIDVIGISIDENEKAYKHASERDNVPWNDYLDYKGQLSEQLNIHGVPFQFLVNDGEIAKVINSENVRNDLLDYLKNGSK